MLNLIPGRSYAVYLFALDHRTAWWNRRIQFADPFSNPNGQTNVSQIFRESNDVYVVANFVAATTTQTIQELGPDGGMNFNVVIVRDLTPEPYISQQPTPATHKVYAGGTPTFTAAGGIPSLPGGYLWQKGVSGTFTDVPNSYVGLTAVGNNSLSIKLGSLTTADSGDYRVILTNMAGAVTSLTATLEVLDLPTSGTFQSAALSFGATYLWQFDETTGSTAYEYIKGLDGTYGPAVVLDQDGPLVDGWSFVGTDRAFLTGVSNAGSGVIGRVQTPVPGFTAYSNFTVVAWIYPTNKLNAGASSGLVYDRLADSSRRGFQMSGIAGVTNSLGYSWNGNNSLTWGWIPTNQIGIPIQVFPDEWSLVALVVSPSNAIIYVDGADTQLWYATNTMPHGAEAFDAPLYIAGQPNPFSGTSWDFAGKVDDVAIFNNRSLSQDDISALYWGNSLLAPSTAPTGLTATPGNAQVSLAWNAVTGGGEWDGYVIKRGTTHLGPYIAIGTNLNTAFTPAATTFVDTNAVNDTTYYYIVGTFNPAGEADSSEVSATPKAASVPNFTFTPAGGGVSGVTVTFHDISTGSHTNLFWDFGDGSSLNTAPGDVTHTFTLPAGVCVVSNMTVQLTATNYVGGGSTYSAPVPIYPAAAAGSLSFSFGPDYGAVGTAVTFLPSWTGCVATNVWHYGDGTTDVNVNPGSHIYAGAGSYDAWLEAYTAYGDSRTSVVKTVHVGSSTVYPSSVSILKVQVQTNDLKLIGTNYPLNANANFYVRWTNNVGLSKATWVTNGSVVGDTQFNARDGLFTNVIIGGATNGSKGFYFIHAP